MFLTVLLIPERRGEWILGEQLTASAREGIKKDVEDNR